LSVDTPGAYLRWFGGVDLTGKAAVLKTAGRKPLGVRVPLPPLVNRLSDLLRRRPRIGAAVAFGLAGTTLPALWYLPLTIQSRNPVLHSLLFVGLPGIAAAIAGGAIGRPLLVPAPQASAGRAALRGAVIASVALLIFAPLFATVFTLTDTGRGHWKVLGLTALLLEGSALAAWWIAAAIGAGVGWLCFRMARRAWDSCPLPSSSGQ
jgi:hypothetical protein